MHIGTLTKVIGIYEDSQSAYRSRIKNRAYRDPNTTVAMTFDNSFADFERQAVKMMPPKDAKKFNKALQNDREKIIKKQMKIDQKYGGIPRYRINKKDYEEAYDTEHDSPTETVAAYNSGAKLIGVNKSLNNGIIDKNGNINFNTKLMTHEKQHEVQNKIRSEYIKSKGKNHQNKVESEVENQEYRLRNLMNIYSSDPYSREHHYVSLPTEFDANAAATRGYNSAGKGTIRSTMQKMGKWPGREIKPNAIHAHNLHNNVMNGQKIPPAQRLELNKYVQQEIPERYRKNYLQAPNKPSTTPLPAKTQEFMNKTSNKINKQIQNGRTFTNKDLENAQPLRQNPIPRKQR